VRRRRPSDRGRPGLLTGHGNAVIHVWRSASRTGEVKAPKSRRSLELPKRAVTALHAHRKRQAAERLAAGPAWQDSNLVFCHEDGRMYTSDALNWRFGKMTRASRQRPLARPRRQAHRGLDHEQQRRPVRAEVCPERKEDLM
jgi:hypothetical protein